MKHLFLALALSAASCTHSIHMVHSSDYEPSSVPLEKQTQISARSEQFVIMGFTKENHYVNKAREELESKCENGIIHGITTQFSTSHGFFSWTNVILMKGYCLKKA